MGRLIRIASVLAIVAGILLIWKNSLPPRPQQSIKVATLIHGTEVGAVFGALVGTFSRIAPVLKDGVSIPAIREVQLHPLVVAKGLEQENSSFALWVAPHSQFVSTRRVNSSTPTQCTPLFRSQLGVVGPKSLLPENRPITNGDLQAIMQKAFVALPDPIESATGWSIYKTLRCGSTEVGDLYSSALASAVFVGKSEQAILTQVLSQGLSQPIISILSEDQVSERIQTNRSLTFRPLADQFFSPAYSLCINESADNSALEIAGLFIRFITTTLAKDIGAQYGYRSPESVPQNPACNKELLGDLLSSPQQQKAEGTVYVVDASSSMEGKPLAIVLDMVKQRSAHASEKELFGVVSFQSKSQVLSEVTSDPKRLIDPLSSIHAEGGSAVNDGILQGIQLLHKLPRENFLKHLIVITDGQDSNSDTILFNLLDAVSQEYQRSPFTFHIVGVNTSSRIPFEPLKEVARAAHGSFMAVPVASLRSTLFDLQ